MLVKKQNHSILWKNLIKQRIENISATMMKKIITVWWKND